MLRSQSVQITHGKFKNIHLHWFPDGRRLISTTNQDGKVGMSIISAADGESHRVEIGDEFSGDYYTSVSPDGRYLFFSSNGDIYWVDARIIERLRTVFTSLEEKISILEKLVCSL